MASRIAVASKTPALLPEFRLAPEHPLSAALEDGLMFYRRLVDDGISPQRIVIAGDSSGGGLAVALTVWLRDKNFTLPAAIICLSPWVDLALTGASLASRASVDPTCSIAESQRHAVYYIGEQDARLPLISPIYADMHSLPPMLIHVGDREILLSNAVELNNRARRDGVDTGLEVWEGMWHVFASYVPEGKRAINAIGDSIPRHID